MSTVTININGMEYNLKGRETEEYLLQIANYVEGKIKDLSENNRKLSTTAASTLAAINIADELYKADKEIENLYNKNALLEEKNIELDKKVKNISEDTTKIDELNKFIEELKKENDSLRVELENYSSEIGLIKEKNNDLTEKEKIYMSKLDKLNEEYNIIKEIQYTHTPVKAYPFLVFAAAIIKNTLPTIASIAPTP